MLRRVHWLVVSRVLDFVAHSTDRCSRRAVFALILLGLWLGLTTLAVSPDLHHRLHADGKDLRHECVFTTLVKGHFTPCSLPVTATLPPVRSVETVRTCELLFHPIPDFSSPPGRGPPSAAVLS